MLLLRLLKRRAAPLAPLVWEASVASDAAQSVIRWGTAGGQMQTTTRTVVEGKQGRSAREQLISEVRSIAKRKQDRDGYVVDVEEMSDQRSEGTHDSHFLLKERDETAEKPADLVDSCESPPLPMLASTYSPRMVLPSGAIIHAQPKMDGLRCLADISTGKIFSRSRHEFASLPHISSAILAACAPARQRFMQSQVRFLDGELFSPSLDFQSITSLVRRGETPHADAAQLRLFVFDAVALGLNFAQRWDLAKSIQSNAAVELVSSEQVELAHFDAASLLQSQLIKGFEGVMFRLSTDDPESFYRPGMRSKHLIKHKTFEQDEFAVAGMNKHRETDTLGSITLRLKDGRVFNAAPAVNKASKQEMWTNRNEYMGDSQWLATVRYHHLTRDGIPRFPRVVGFRHQKDIGP